MEGIRSLSLAPPSLPASLRPSVRPSVGPYYYNGRAPLLYSRVLRPPSLFPSSLLLFLHSSVLFESPPSVEEEKCKNEASECTHTHIRKAAASSSVRETRFGSSSIFFFFPLTTESEKTAFAKKKEKKSVFCEGGGKLQHSDQGESVCA